MSALWRCEPWSPLSGIQHHHLQNGSSRMSCMPPFPPSAFPCVFSSLPVIPLNRMAQEQTEQNQILLQARHEQPEFKGCILQSVPKSSLGFFFSSDVTSCKHIPSWYQVRKAGSRNLKKHSSQEPGPGLDTRCGCSE